MVSGFPKLCTAVLSLGFAVRSIQLMFTILQQEMTNQRVQKSHSCFHIWLFLWSVSNLVSLIKLVNELRTDLILQTTLCPPYFQEKKPAPEFRFIDPLSVSLLMWYRWWVDYCSVNVRETVSVANSNHLINSCSVEVQELGWPWHRDRLTNEEKGLSTQPHLLSE